MLTSKKVARDKYIATGETVMETKRKEGKHKTVRKVTDKKQE